MKGLLLCLTFVRVFKMIIDYSSTAFQSVADEHEMDEKKGKLYKPASRFSEAKPPQAPTIERPPPQILLMEPKKPVRKKYSRHDIH